MKKFVILIPVYNDWKSVFKLLDKIELEITTWDAEVSILIINDASIAQSDYRGSEKKLTRYTEVMEIGIHDADKLGQELYYWEFSVALIGLMLGINPFNQPDVELSKRIFEEIESRSEDWFGAPLFENSMEDTFEQISAEVEFGKYIAILPYLNPSDRCREVFENLRSRLESYFHVPVVF